MFFRKMLIAIDDSAPSQYAIEVGLIVAQRDKSPVIFALVLDPALLEQNFGFSSICEMAQKMADDIIAGALQRAKQAGVEATSQVLFSDATRGIIELARTENVGLIVMGTHGRSGIARALTRSIAEEVLRQTKTPLCVIRRPPIGKIHEKILVPIVNDDLGQLAVNYSIELAQNFNSSLFFCTVTNGSGTSGATGFLDSVRAYARQQGVESNGLILEGPVCDAIREHAETQDTDIIVMASHARDGFMRLVRGSITEAVIRTSLIPVVVVR